MTLARERYDAATALLSARVIVDASGIAVGKIVVKGRETPSGHMYRCWLHIYGHRMVEGHAKGGGYDMQAAAISSAFSAAWPDLKIHERAQLEPVARGLESTRIDHLQPVSWRIYTAI